VSPDRVFCDKHDPHAAAVYVPAAARPLLDDRCALCGVSRLTEELRKERARDERCEHCRWRKSTHGKCCTSNGAARITTLVIAV
jgi:hypothetical protein